MVTTVADPPGADMDRVPHRLQPLAIAALGVLALTAGWLVGLAG